MGVAAHITAASPEGARNNSDLSAVERSDIGNGIWLCQTHAKLIDDDELTFPPALLLEWKETAEHMAALEARGYSVRKAAPFPKLELQAPKLIAEMRADLQEKPLVRQFIIKRRNVSYSYGSTPLFEYYLEDHDQLLAVMTIFEHAGAIYNVKFNAVDRYNFKEDFVSFLLGE